MILVVEDEPIYQKLIASSLEKNGWKIDIASDGFGAIDMFNPSIHKLAIVDLVLPGAMNGLEVIKKLLHLQPELKILVCSGYGTQTIQNKINKAGAHHFINKPFTPNQMLGTVSKILGISGPAAEKSESASELPHKEHEPNIIQPDLVPAPTVIPELFINFDQAVVEELCLLGQHIKIEKFERTRVNYTVSIIIILDGSVRCYDQDNVLGILKAGNCLGYESLAKEIDATSILTLEGLEESIICSIPKIEFLQYFCGVNETYIALLEKNVRHALQKNPIYQHLSMSSRNASPNIKFDMDDCNQPSAKNS